MKSSLVVEERKVGKLDFLRGPLLESQTIASFRSKPLSTESSTIGFLRSNPNIESKTIAFLRIDKPITTESTFIQSLRKPVSNLTNEVTNHAINILNNPTLSSEEKTSQLTTYLNAGVSL